MAKTIIVHADDDGRVTSHVAELLGDTDYEILSHYDGKAVLERSLERIKRETQMGRQVVLITDKHMTFMHGPELIKALQDKGISIPTIMLSGDEEKLIRPELAKKGIDVDVILPKMELTKLNLEKAIQDAVGSHQHRDRKKTSEERAR
jgi:FixJ family two-component response regulator